MLDLIAELEASIKADKEFIPRNRFELPRITAAREIFLAKLKKADAQNFCDGGPAWIQDK